MFKIQINDTTKCTIIDDATGKTYEATGSWHARTLNDTYKYHEYYVFTNKLDISKYPELKPLATKAPKTLQVKWNVEPKDENVEKWWLDIKNWAKIKGPKLKGYTEKLSESKSRSKVTLNELDSLFE